ncbi:Inosine triphosphate pyrophosphatase [Glycine soja]|uniref:Inosine triphosphate pyrophosphatase n=1 Tax=Glycine soja TaxID=3848 RepID=A0A445HRP5_GLYSO|nr:Inosine triphosphate pyrophosphatase [Glycine soja]
MHFLGNSIPFQSLKLDLPELQGEPEDISKEKARIAALQVHWLPVDIIVIFFFSCSAGPYMKLGPLGIGRHRPSKCALCSVIWGTFSLMFLIYPGFPMGKRTDTNWNVRDIVFVCI